MPGVLLCCLVHQAHIEPPPPTRLGSYSLVRACVSVTQRSTLGGVLVCRSVRQAFDGPDSIVQLPMLACGVSEAMVMAPPAMHDSVALPCFHSCPAFLHRHSPPQSSPQIPSIRLSAVNSSTFPGISPQSLNSSFQPLCLSGDLHPCLGYVWLWQGLSDSHSIEAATDQLFHSQP